MSIVYRGPVVDNNARVDTVLSFEAGAAVLNFLMTGIQNWCGQTTYQLTAIQIPKMYIYDKQMNISFKSGKNASLEIVFVWFLGIIMHLQYTIKIQFVNKNQNIQYV